MYTNKYARVQSQKKFLQLSLSTYNKYLNNSCVLYKYQLCLFYANADGIFT